MSKLNVVLSILLVIFYAGVFGGSNIQASTTPNFPSCGNPSGQVIANYSDGTHGIVGNTATYTGSDTVYQVSDTGATQCFCDNNGNGIQTNWMKVGEMSQDEIQSYENQGWVLIPNGALWGLDESSYLALNSNYSCSGGGTGGGGGSNSSSSSSSSSSGVGGGNILASAIGPAVLGLANTGNLVNILVLALLGVLALVTGLSIKRKVSK